MAPQRVLLVSPTMDSARDITDSSSCDAVRTTPAFNYPKLKSLKIFFLLSTIEEKVTQRCNHRKTGSQSSLCRRYKSRHHRRPTCPSYSRLLWQASRQSPCGTFDRAMDQESRTRVEGGSGSQQEPRRYEAGHIFGRRFENKLRSCHHRPSEIWHEWESCR